MSRNLEALSLIAHGNSIDRVADKMGISRTMVNAHLKRIRDKLNAKNTVEAVYIAAKTGLIVWTFVCIPLISAFSSSSIVNGYARNNDQIIVMNYRQARRSSRRSSRRETRSYS